MQNKEKDRQGDRLLCIIYERNATLLRRKRYKLYYLNSILSFQRQYYACTEVSHDDLSLGNKLLGKKDACFDEDDLELPENHESRRPSDSQPHTSDENQQSEEGDKDDSKLEDLNLVVPPLNESQEKAANDFLSAAKGSISIVQG